MYFIQRSVRHIVCRVHGTFLFPESKEYCQFESFNASCSANQVIVMEDAQYGRIKTGRCVARDYGYMGCSMSVLHLLDRTCSGRRWCEYAVPKLRELVQPCPKDLISYLEATYRCVAGMPYIHASIISNRAEINSIFIIS